MARQPNNEQLTNFPFDDPLPTVARAKSLPSDGLDHKVIFANVSKALHSGGQL